MYQYIVLSYILIILLVGCGKRESGYDGKDQTENNIQTTTISTPSIMCGMCVSTIKKTVSAVEGVYDVEVDLQKKITTVKFNKTKLDITTLEKFISDAGYDANETPRNRESYNSLPDCCKDGK